MTLREIARAFNMTVAEFSKYIGYTRQALYGNNLNYMRVKTAIRLLYFLKQKQYEEGLKKSAERADKQEEAIREFGKMFGYDAGEVEGGGGR